MRIHPFHGYVVRPDVAERVVAPPRGRRTRAELDALGESEPLSILNVVRSGSTIPPERRAEHRLASARRLRSLLRLDVFVPLEEPEYLIYRSTDDGRTVTGLLAEVPIATYEDGHLKPHERLRDDQVARMADHLDEVGASTLPVMVGYRSQAGSGAAIEDAIDEATVGDPLVDVTVAETRQTLWSMPAHRRDEARRTLADVPDLYIADGHHRVEAVRRVARRRRQRASDADPDAPYERLLVLLVSADRLQTAPYHRWVRDADRTDTDGLPGKLRERGFDVIEVGSEPVHPERNGEFGMLLDDTWFRLSAPDHPPSSSPTDRLNVSVLHDRVLTPLFGIDDPGSDPRLEFIPGAEGVEGLIRRCEREGGIGFALAPTEVEDVLDLADDGQTMPPKSTWFVPKLPSGLVLRLIEGLAGPGDRAMPTEEDPEAGA